MPDSKSSNNAAWLAWSACHAVFGSSFVSVEFFSEESAAGEPQKSDEDNALPASQFPDSCNIGRYFH